MNCCYNVSIGTYVLYVLLYLAISSDCNLESACVRKDCDHPRARSWVQCSCCNEWYHCVCEEAAYSDMKKKDYVFVCKKC